jgi:hypothetical protein
MKQPLWSPAYKKPLAYGFLFGIAIFWGLLTAAKSVAPTENTKLIRGWQVSGKYSSDTSRGRRNSWATKIGEEYVICVGSVYGGKTDCPKDYEGRQVTAIRVAMPSFDGDQLVIAELREGEIVRYSRSDLELLEQWKASSSGLSLFISFAIGLVIGMAFAVLNAIKSSPVNRNV